MNKPKVFVIIVVMIMLIVNLPIGLSASTPINATETRDPIDFHPDTAMIGDYTRQTTTSGYCDGMAYNVKLSYSVGAWAGKWDEGVWRCTYKIAGHGISTGHLVFNDGFIRGAAMDIKTTYNQSQVIMDPIGANAGLWTRDDSNTTPNTTNISEKLIEFAVGCFLSGGASVIYNAALAIMDLLIPSTPSSTDTNYSMWRYWSWYPGLDATDQHFYFHIYINPGASVSYYMRYVLFGLGYEALVPSSVVFNINAPSSNPELMNDQELEEAGILKISKSDLDVYSDILDLSSDELSDMRTSDKDYFYFCNLIVSVEDYNYDWIENLNESNISLEKLKAAIAYHLDRSELIIKAYNDPSNEWRDTSIIETINKHERRISNLNELEIVLSDDNLLKCYEQYKAIITE